VNIVTDIRVGRDLKMWRRAWSIAAALACVGGASGAVADESRSLPLPTAMSPEALAKESARGGSPDAEADATVKVDQAQSNASAQATVGPISIVDPVTTGNVGSFPGVSGASGQVSTGIGNIQQGVSAVLIIN
jgi:hypothetical protein